jgi:hypothetical protein
MRLIAISAALLVVAASSAFGQDRAGPLTPLQPSTENPAAMPQAPTGHRQPRARDLPPDLARREQGGEQPRSSEAPNSAQRSGIDPRLRICRTC